MKLLIIEDEVATREGLVGLMLWEDLGIKEVRSAPNGERGLVEARSFRPDIILSDIRMPRMDGITLAGQVRQFLPHCNIIFISAYSEKAYFKAAIQLKVVQFIEKPIDHNELKAAVLEAIQYQKRQNKVAMYGDAYKQSIRNELAYDLSKGAQRSEQSCYSQLEDCDISTKNLRFFTSAIFRMDSCIEENKEAQWLLDQTLDDVMNALAISCISYWKNTLLVVHIMSANHVQKSVYEELLIKMTEASGYSERSFAVIGNEVSSIMDIKDSYHSAVTGYQMAFYGEYGCVYHYEMTEPLIAIQDYMTYRDDFSRYLNDRNWEAMLDVLENYYSNIMSTKPLTVKPVRETYFHFAVLIYQKADEWQIMLHEGNQTEDVRMGMMNEDNNLNEVHEKLSGLIERLRKGLEKCRLSSTTVQKIIHFIQMNYMNSDLTIGDVGKYMNKSTPYLCTVFKQEQDMTINQYITDYRIHMAKKFLKDNGKTVKDVATLVGYTDGSYFTKIFKKIEGMTPSQYIEVVTGDH